MAASAIATGATTTEDRVTASSGGAAASCGLPLGADGGHSQSITNKATAKNSIRSTAIVTILRMRAVPPPDDAV
jgi:hypothetical protein